MRQRCHTTKKKKKKRNLYDSHQAETRARDLVVSPALPQDFGNNILILKILVIRIYLMETWELYTTLAIIHCTVKQFLEDSRNQPATLLSPIASIMLAVSHSCYIPLPRRALRAWEAFLPTPRSPDLQAQPRAMLRASQNTQPAEPSTACSSVALSVHPLQPGIKSLPSADFRCPSSPPCAVPLHKLLFFVLSGFVFKFIFGLFSLQQKTLKLLSKITLLIFITKYPTAGCWGGGE